MAKLEVQIGADSSELNAEISAAESKIARLKKEKAIQVKLGLDTSSLNKSITDAKTQLASLKKSVDNTSQSFAGMKPQVANGGNALMQFSRIAQDAPYGIIGIGNNITATAEAFTHLSKTSGGAGNALKAVASSLMGTGGILLAVSLVTTGLTLLSQSGLTMGDVFDKLTGNNKEYAKSLTEVKEGTNSAVAAAGGEIASLRALASVAQNVSLSQRERLDAVKQLQSQYPGYFSNMSKEKIMNGDLVGVINEVTKALLAKARAAFFTDKIIKNDEKLYNAQDAINNLNLELGRIQDDLLEKRKRYAAYSQNADNQTGAFLAKYKSQIEDLESKEMAILEAKNGQLLIQGKVIRGNKVIQEQLNSQIGLSMKLNESSSGKVKTPATGVTPKVAGLDTAITSQGLAETSGKILQVAKNVQGAEGLITTSMGNINVAFDTSTAGMLEALQYFNDAASDIINESIANTFSSLGSAIGNAMASGGNVMKAAGSALLASVGTLLTNLGTMAIQVGVGLLGIKLALKTLNPAVAIGAGVALVALGAVFSSKASALGSSSGGGVSSSNSPQTGASYSTPSASNSGSGSGSFGGGTVVFEISGNSLIGVLSNALDKNKRLGGSLGIV